MPERGAIVHLQFFDGNDQSGFQRRNGKPGDCTIIVIILVPVVIAITILLDVFLIINVDVPFEFFSVGGNMKNETVDFMLAKPNIAHPRFFQAFNVDAWNRL